MEDVEREGQGYPCWPQDMMMMMIYIYIYILKLLGFCNCKLSKTCLLHYTGAVSLLKKSSIHGFISSCRESHDLMVKVLNCGVEVSEFELQSRYYVHFQTNTREKDMKSLITSSIDCIVSLLFFYKDGTDNR